MSAYFLITKVILQPLPILLLISGAVLVSLWRRKRESRGRLLLVIVPLASLTILSVPAAVHPLVGGLEWSYPPSLTRPAGADAIVVLAGGITQPNRYRPWPELTEDTIHRCLHAARLYHDGPPCPVIVTGGTLDPGSPLAPVAPSMRELLIQLGVRDDDILVESHSRTTFENATETRQILNQKGLKNVVLVTEAVHMLRSVRCFRKLGIEVMPSACFHRATQLRWELDYFLPSPGALKDFMAVLHEWLGLAWYMVQGRN
jgi:uncharacterized SAM-binding protein YcdF (DUF218 family)